jgi:hypothetical protein
MAYRPIIKMITPRLHAGARALPAALALAALAAAPASAGASSLPPVAFILSPVGTTSSVSLHGSLGHALAGAVLVRNMSRRPIAVILQRADIRNASNGNADYVTTRLSGAGLWLHLSAQRVRLAAHASRRVAYTVSIPSTTTGGSHYAGIVAINAADFSASARGKGKGGEFTFKRISREAVPLTIHLRGRLWRGLSLRWVKLIAEPIGAGLVLGLRPSGTELTQGARMHLRVLRGARRIFTYNSTIGQMFPGDGLSYRISWPGRPTPGSYRLLGTIRPRGLPVIKVDRTFGFSTHSANHLKSMTPSATQAPTTRTPGWVWVALGCGVALLTALLVAVLKLAGRPHGSVA